MSTYKDWFMDFDDTLATSSMTWAIKHAFPKLIQAHSLPNDDTRLLNAVTAAQQRASRERDPRPILEGLFQTMEWPVDLSGELLEDIMRNYKPQLFDDTIPFLERLVASGSRVYILSNNPRANDLALMLNIRQYVTSVITPKSCEGCLPKPHPSMWDFVLRTYPEVEAATSIIIGDDPWSEGEFAQNCGLHHAIIDRLRRFTDSTEFPCFPSLAAVAI